MSFERFLVDGDSLPQIRGISYSILKSGKASFLHTHNFTEILVVISGSGYIKSAADTYVLNANDTVIINPLAPHTEEQKAAGSHLEYFVISLKDVFFTRRQPNTDDSDDNYTFFIGAAKSDYALKSNTQSLLKAFKSPNRNGLEMSAAIYNFIAYLLASHNLCVRADSTYSKTSAVEYTKNLIINNLAAPVNLDEIARKFYISKSYLIKSFTKDMGVPPIKYCIQQRIQESQYLLKNTDLSITQIAVSVGFASSAYFAKTFKGITGLTPKQYRNHLTPTAK